MLAKGLNSAILQNYGTNPNTGTPINNQLSEHVISLTDNNGCLSSPLTFSVDIFELTNC